jgi:hypothetical protein
MDPSRKMFYLKEKMYHKDLPRNHRIIARRAKQSISMNSVMPWIIQGYGA